MCISIGLFAKKLTEQRVFQIEMRLCGVREKELALVCVWS